ncbi:Aluminum-activated malate transporter [Thalictrum thalictroides]|uniref:Aluminum-activated malate transporter n=1 Tax=Thalictrum thalictroides TaxID=46969 RepID=A0A7J6VLE0_THATH|nr:Aluminum-activated malate transporter [Thalictrum thalictroides]
MEINGSENHEKTGLFSQRWSGIKALSKRLEDRVVGIGSKTMKLGKDDPRRIVHSFKVGLALSLVCIFYYFKPVYDSYGDSAIWAVLTVVVVFEFSVGATLGKCINRGFATLLAGALGIGAHELATLAGEKGEPIILSVLVFLLATAATFSRFFPRIKARYDYGVVVFILTFSLVSVSGYRVDEILEVAHQRLSTVAIGGMICVVVSIMVCPVWAGEDLHKLVAFNIEKIADFLEGFGGEYFAREGDGESTVASKSDKSFLKGYKSALNSRALEESLANFAQWEPFHGHFMFHHPWNQYLKIGALTRQCAYQVEALNIYVNSDIQVPEEFKKKIQEACTNMSLETGMALRELASGIRTMTQDHATNIHVSNSKSAAENLKTNLMTTALPAYTDLTRIIPAATVSSLLVEIVSCTEVLAESVHELARLAKFKSVDPTVSPDRPKQTQLLHRGTVNPFCDSSGPHTLISVCELPSAVLPENVNIQNPVRGQHMQV